MGKVTQLQILTEDFLSKYPDFPEHMNELGKFVFLRTYSRFLEKEGRRETWKETCARAVEYNLSLQINYMIKNGIQFDIEEMRKEGQFLFDNQFNLRQSLSGRTNWVGGADTGVAHKFPLANFNCFSRDTEFITDKGIKSFYDFEDGDTVNVLSSTGGWKEATVKNFGEDEIVELTVRRGKRVEIIKTTSNHRWYVRKSKGEKKYTIKTTSELKKGQILRTKKRYEHTSIVPCSIGIQHGIVFGDGTYDKKMNHCRVHLINEKKELESLFTTGSKTTAGKYDQVVIYGLPNTWKELPSLNTNVEYLYGFLMGLFATDGNNYGNQHTIANKNKEVLEHIKDICSLVGINTSNIRTVREVSPFDNSESYLYELGLSVTDITEDFLLRTSHKNNFKPNDSELLWKVESVNYTGRKESVWCVQEPETESFTLANGILTKNCSFTNIESPKDLAELFYLLLVGTGVGFKVTNDLVDNFPRVNTKIKFVHKDYEYDKNRITKLENTTLEEDGEIIYLTVGDSKEGWVEALLYTFTILTDKKYSGVKEIHYNYDYVRPAGEPLKTFGGTASGPEPLREMFEGIDKVIHNQLDPHLEPLDVDEHGYAKLRAIHLVDISNLIGYNVVVGGVRRTSEIALGSDSDWEFILAKYGINGIWGDEGFERHEKIKQELIKLGIPIPKFWDELSVKYYYVYDKDEYRKAMNGEMSLADVRKIGEFTSPEEAIKCALENGYDEGEYFPYPCNEKRPLHHRRMSNNSIVFIHKPKRELLKLLFMLMESEGEPGFINLRAAAIRRLKAAGNENLTEEQIVKEAVKLGLNPCAEILLQSKGVCNLTTVNVMSFVKEDGSFDLSGLLEAQKASAKAGLRMTLVELELDKWNEVQQEDRLLGCSLTGWQDAMDVVGYDKEKQKVLLNILKETAIEEANKLADQLGVNRPLLVTTVKPEGTLSQVFGGVSSGLHFSHSPYYIRRIRINANDPLAKTVLAHKGWVINPEIGTPGKTREEKMRNARTLVIDFPIASGAKRTKDDVKVDEQFDIYFMFQEYYTQHNTSNTIHVHPDQWQRAEERVWEGWDNFVGVSFLAHNGGTYALAPYEAITKEEYEKRVAEMEALDYNLLKLFEVGADLDLDGLDGCEGGICPIR